MNVTQYHPELNGIVPDAEIEAEYSVVIRKWKLTTKLELKGRGIEFEKKYTANDLVPQAQHLIGYNKYYATGKAMETLEKKYTVRQPLLFN